MPKPKLPPVLPRHIALFMDGNGRWAKKRLMPRKAGHKAGAETFRRIATYCRDIGIQYLTVYAFSTENWTRPTDEVQSIFKLLDQYLDEALERMERDRVKMKFLGDLSPLSRALQDKIQKAETVSRQYTGCQVNICVNYGGRDEILRAARKLIQHPPDVLDEATFSAALDTAGIPDPDLLIRPSGEFRLSGFLLWQCSYTELFFTNSLWPDFTTKELDKILCAYAKRDRRFGAVTSMDN